MRAVVCTCLVRAGVQPRVLRQWPRICGGEHAAPRRGLGFSRHLSGSSGGGRDLLRLFALPAYRLARKTEEDLAADAADPSSPNGSRFPFKVRLLWQAGFCWQPPPPTPAWNASPVAG